MTKPKISITVPGFRVNNWMTLYDSIRNSTKQSFEVIFIGPYFPTNDLLYYDNVKFIRDWGNVARCHNLGLQVSEGELYSCTSDDATYLGHGIIDQAISAFEEMGNNPKSVLILKYMEGQRIIQPDDYYKLLNAYPKVRIAQPDWYIFNFTLSTTSYFLELGGVDSQFETLALSQADLSVRAHKDGCVTKMFPMPLVFNTHGCPHHAPVASAHVTHDEPLYAQIHNDPQYDNRIKIDINNWKIAPAVWSRRFSVNNHVIS